MPWRFAEAGRVPGRFFTVAALAMRQIVVDYARRRASQKRGGGAPQALLDELDGSAVAVEAQANALVALDAALTGLGVLDERLVRVVELRFFGGLSVEEAADVLEISTATVKRDTRAARAFLAREMSEPRVECRPSAATHTGDGMHSIDF